MSIGHSLLVPALSQHYIQRAGVDGAAALAALQSALGAALKHMWLPDAARVTLSGSNASTVTDIQGVATATLYLGSPVWNASGGPLGRPYINLSTTNACMQANGVNESAGNRTAHYCVGRHPASSAVDTIIAATRIAEGTSGGTPSIGAINKRFGRSATGKFQHQTRFTGGLQTIDTTVSADTNWHLFSVRPLSAGASNQIDGVETSPTFTGTDTAQADAVWWLGQDVGNAAGDWAMSLLVDVTSNAAAIDAAVREFVRSWFGLTV